MTRKSTYGPLTDTHPELIKEWDFEKNPSPPSNYTSGMAYKAWWICPNGHSYQSALYTRRKGSSCPICSGRIPDIGKSLDCTHPELAAEWDFEKNSRVPTEVSFGSRFKIWWKCPAGHSYESAIYHRTGNKRNCPYCCGQKKNAENCLAATHPDLCKMWDPENNSKTTQEVSKGSKYVASWICAKGHKFKSSVNTATKGPWCPVCSHRKIAPEDSLAAKFPDLLSEWDFERNADAPSKIAPGSAKKFWWHCPNGHNYQSSPDKRTSGRGCPLCRGKISKTEAAWLDLLGVPNDPLHRQVHLILNGERFVVDGYDGNKKIVYEFDGDYFHGNPTYFQPNETNRTNKKTFGELYESTLIKRSKLQKAGFIVVSTWESTFLLAAPFYFDRLSHDLQRSLKSRIAGFEKMELDSYPLVLTI